MKWCGRIYSVLIIYCLLICTLNFCISSCLKKKKTFASAAYLTEPSQCSEEWHQHVDLQVVHQSLLYWWAQPGCQTFLVNTSLLCLHPYPLPVEREIQSHPWRPAIDFWWPTDCLDVVEWYRAGEISIFNPNFGGLTRSDTKFANLSKFDIVRAKCFETRVFHLFSISLYFH